MRSGNKKGTKGNTFEILESIDFTGKFGPFKRVQFPPGPLKNIDFMRVSELLESAGNTIGNTNKRSIK